MAAATHWENKRQAHATRIRAAAPALGVHVLLALILFFGLRQNAEELHRPPLKLTLPPPPAAPPEPVAIELQPPARADEPEARPKDEAAPPDLIANPAPIVAPEPAIPPPTPPPVAAAPLPGTGTAPSVGAAPAPGPGTGAGGTGDGRSGGGTGGDGSGGRGAGGGRIAVMPRLLRGDFSYGDIPRALRESGFRGQVGLHFLIDVDGRAKQCRVIRSSGNASMDQSACRALEQRFRFTPARDENGRAVPVAGEDFPEFIADSEASESRRRNR